MFFLRKEVFEQLCIVQIQELIESQRFKVGFLIVFDIKLMEIYMEENLAPKMLRNTVICLLQEINDIILNLFFGNEVEDFADEKVENEFGVVFPVDLEDFLLVKVDEFMSSEPIPAVPDALGKVLDDLLVVDGGDVIYKEIPLPFVSLDFIPDAFIQGDLFMGLKIGLGLGDK